MLIGGLQKFTTLDYPGKIAATVFTAGCNFRCPFCHNPEIIEVDGAGDFEAIDEAWVLDFLRERVGELDGVCISGGEPTLQKDLADFMEKIKEMGFLVKLDTNGSNVEMVKSIIDKNLADYFAIDIKTSFGKYGLVKSSEETARKVLETVGLIISSNIPLELRTTVVPKIVDMEDFDRIVKDLNERDAKILQNIVRYRVQAFRPQKCFDKEFEGMVPYEDEVLEEIAEKIRKCCVQVEVVK